jgi:hypothetical protein
MVTLIIDEMSPVNARFRLDLSPVRLDLSPVRLDLSPMDAQYVDNK